VNAQPAASLRLLSAGAAKGLVEALAGAFEAETGAQIEASFDSAGATRAAFADGAGCDVVILPASMLDALAAQRLVDGGSIAALGAVPTGIAVATGDRLPDVGNADTLRASLRHATALYCPDISRATAGIHFAGVLRTLGIDAVSAAKLRTYANGARAMAALAAEGAQGAIGCTQVTEILYTPGVVLVGPLPAPFGLATVYAVAVSASASADAAARAFAARLTGDASRALRRAGGFVEHSTRS
jgi:molybdate transport system substrate-binding protein